MLVSKLKFKKRHQQTISPYQPQKLACLNKYRNDSYDSQNEVIITYFLPKAAFNEFNANEELRR